MTTYRYKREHPNAPNELKQMLKFVQERISKINIALCYEQTSPLDVYRASENRTLNGFYRLIFPNTAQTHLIIRKYYLHSFVCLEKNQLDKNCSHLMTRKFLVILGSEDEVRLPPFEGDEPKKARIVRHKASRARFPIA